MSVLDFNKQSSAIICRMPCCEWYGHYSELEEHFNITHPDRKSVIGSNSSWEIIINKRRQREPYLLCDNNNNEIYWFYYAEGLFAISSESKNVEYYVSISFSTPANDIITEIRGPFTSEDENSAYFMDDIENEEQKLTIYFGNEQQDTKNEEDYLNIIYEENRSLEQVYQEIIDLNESNHNDPEEEVDDLADEYLENYDSEDEGYHSDESSSDEEDEPSSDEEDEPIVLVLLYQEYVIDFCGVCYHISISDVVHPNALDLELQNFPCLLNNVD